MPELFDWRKLTGGWAKFCGVMIGADEHPHDVFAIQVRLHVSFGEFRLLFHSDETRFDAEVVSFGYGSPRNVGNPSPGARGVFSPAQILEIKALAVELLGGPREKPFPLQKREFTGQVAFRNGWVRQR